MGILSKSRYTVSRYTVCDINATTNEGMRATGLLLIYTVSQK